VQKPYPPIYFSGTRDPRRSARRIAKYGLSGWIGIQDSPEEITRWRSEIDRELGELGRELPEGFDMCSMIWFVITDTDVDQTPAGKASNLLVGSAQQVEDILKRYQEAGMTMPLLWPPFRDVPTAKTMDDLKRLTEEILPKVNAQA
jgi:alkanesulfonate monooxygenase SsuD/methylene tetrahydromethanopterin reductase-like flavin-dependent oxidoreductase (luciferase family)